MRLIKAILAAIVLAAFTVGVPIVLLAAIGNPTTGFTEGIVTNKTILDAIACLAWLFWGQMVIAFTFEAINQIGELRGANIHLPVPAIGAQHNMVRALIGAVLMVGVVGSTFTAGAGKAEAATPAHSAPTTTISHAHQATQVAASTSLAHAGYVTVTVHQGDTLWDLAATHLGDGTHWRQIVEANQGHNMGGGVIATAALLRSDLQPGWQLRIPTTNTTPSHSVRSTVVEPGDTLSSIAQHDMGKASDWPALYEANQATIGSNPDLIQPGQHLNIPSTNTSPETTVKHQPVANPETAPDGYQTGSHAAPPAVHPATPPVVVPHAPTVKPHGAHRVETPQKPAVIPSETAPSNTVESNSPTTQLYANATPTPGQAAQIQRAQHDHEQAVDAASPSLMAAAAPWAIAGLVGSGSMLAGALYLRLRDRRRDKFRARRPGRALSAPPVELAAVEMTITAAGGPASKAIESIDLELRRLGYLMSQAGSELPSLAAIEVAEDQVLAHLTAPAALPAPWREVTEDQLRWWAPIHQDPSSIEGWDRPAPYPLLVTVGQSEDGHWWLLNCEQLGAITVTGNEQQAQDLVRSLAAELAVAGWAKDARLDLVGVGAELASIDPDRVYYRDHDNLTTTVSGLVSDALAMVDRTHENNVDTATGRATQPDDEVWDARLLLIDASSDQATDVDNLIELIRDHPGRTATALINASSDPKAFTLTLVDGHLVIDAVGLTLTPVALSPDEAAAISALYQHAAEVDDAPMPINEHAQGWEEFVDAAGNIREEHTIARSTPVVGFETVSQLEQPDHNYVTTAAVTAEDLEVLAPRIPAEVAQAIGSSDPHLAQDMEEWLHHARRQPYLRLLGPVKAFAYGEGTSTVAERMSFFSELLAFLWTKKDQGATMVDLQAAFPGVAESTLRPRIRELRRWLGNNAITGKPILPAANQAPAKAHHGQNVYQVDCSPGGLLVDDELLRRKRAASKSASGEAGISHLREALAELVSGRPFDDLRTGGWSWMFEGGQRLDEIAVAAISDMALTASSFYLEQGDLTKAKMIAEIGVLAAPYEENMRLGMVAIKEAEGNRTEAMDQLDAQVLNRSDDGTAPRDLSERTRRILNEHGWGEAV